MTSKTYLLHILFIISFNEPIRTAEDGYLRYVKDGCFIRGEALSCVKYKALKLAKKTIFGSLNSNETIPANQMISFVPLDDSTISSFEVQDLNLTVAEPRGFFSEWTELTKYVVKTVKDFFKLKGLRINLPEGTRTIEDEEEEGRGRKKKLAVIVPLLTLLAALKTKLLLVPILLAVLLIKKLLLLAALLVPSLLHTLKACKVHHPGYHSFFGAADTPDFSSGYGNTFYSSGSGYNKDWASNRAYSMPKRVTTSPVYMTAPGAVAS